MTKLNQRFLGVQKVGESSEYEHIIRTNDKSDREDEVRKLAKAGLSSRKIGKQLNISHTQVQRIIKEFAGQNGGTCSSVKV